MKSHGKLLKILIPVAIGLIIVGVAVGVLINRPKSVANQVKVTFSGYNGYGTLSYNAEDVDNFIKKAVYKKAGFNKTQVEALISGSDAFYAQIYADPKLTKKLNKATVYYEALDWSFDKMEKLKNGQKVKFTVKSSVAKSPIKAETKEFKVKGLEKMKEVKIADLLEKYPVTCKGPDGYGSLSFDTGDADRSIFEVKDGEKNDKLKNGDKVKIRVSDYYLEQLRNEGKMVDRETAEIKVDGLKPVEKLGNLGELPAQIETLIKADHESSDWVTYTIEKMDSYLRYQSDAEYGEVSLVTIFKVTEDRKYSDPSVTYKKYGYTANVLSDGSLDLDTKTKITNSWGTKDLENLIATLKTDGYSKYEVQAADAAA